MEAEKKAKLVGHTTWPQTQQPQQIQYTQPSFVPPQPFTQAYLPPIFNCNYNHSWQPQPNPQTQNIQPTAQAQPTQEQLPPPPAHPPKQENQTTNSQPAALPSFGMIMPISGGSTLDFENKRQHRDYFRQVHCIVSEGPTKRTSGHTLRSPSLKMSTSSATHTQTLSSSRQIFRAGGLARY